MRRWVLIVAMRSRSVPTLVLIAQLVSATSVFAFSCGSTGFSGEQGPTCNSTLADLTNGVASHLNPASTDDTQKRIKCPCVAEPFFQGVVGAQRVLLACTNNTPFENFVRVVAPNLDLIVLFEAPGQLYCGWQPVGFNTSYRPVSAAEFDFCRRLMVRAANFEGIPCLPEL